MRNTRNLSDQLWKFKNKFPQKYSQLLERCKWEVRAVEEKNSKGIVIRTRYVVYYNKETGDTLKQEIMLQFMVCQREKKFFNLLKEILNYEECK